MSVKDAAARIAERFRPEIITSNLRLIEAEAIEVEPTMEELARDVEHTREMRDQWVKAHQEACVRWRDRKKERGLE